MKELGWFTVLKREPTVVGLVSGRHEMPVDEYVWQGPLSGGLKENLGRLYNEALQWLKKNYRPGTQDVLHLYVTGYTPALTAFLRAWRTHRTGFVNRRLILFHYDMETKTYESEVWRD